MANSSRSDDRAASISSTSTRNPSSSAAWRRCSNATRVAPSCAMYSSLCGSTNVPFDSSVVVAVVLRAAAERHPQLGHVVVQLVRRPSELLDHSVRRMPLFRVGGKFSGTGGELPVFQVAGKLRPAVDVVEGETDAGDHLPAVVDPGVGRRLSFGRPFLFAGLIA